MRKVKFLLLSIMFAFVVLVSSVKANVVSGSNYIGDIEFFGLCFDYVEVNPFEKVNVEFTSTGQDYSNTTIKATFRSVDGVYSFVSDIESLNSNPYFLSGIGSGEDVKYKLESVTIMSNGEINTWYTHSVENGNYFTCHNDSTFTLKGAKSTSSNDWTIGDMTFTSLQVPNATVKPGDKVYVDLFASNYDNARISVQFSEVGTGVGFAVNLEDLNTKPYFIVPESVRAGSKYELYIVTVYNGNEIKSYSTKQGTGDPYMNVGDKKYFTVKAGSSDWEVGKILFTNLQIPNVTVEAGDKVYVDLYAGGDFTGGYISVGFAAENDYTDSFIVYLKSLQKDPYFVVPDTVKAGTRYELRSVNIFSDNKSHSYYTYQVTNGTYMNAGASKFFTVKESVAPVVSNSDILTSISFDGTTYKAGDKVKVNLGLSKTVDYVSIHLINRTNMEQITQYVINPNSTDAYIILPEDIVACEYKLQDVYVFVGDTSTHYSNYSGGDNILKLKFSPSITVESTSANENTNTNVNNITIKDETAYIGEKSYVTLDSYENISSILLNFYSSSLNKSFNVYLKSLSDNPYFIVPSLTSESSYQLKSVIIKNKDASVVVFQGTEEMLNQKVDVKLSTTKSSYLFFDNDSVNKDVLDNIDKSSMDSIISIDANNNSIISSSIFDSIKESRRTVIVDYEENEWVFNGTDIDVSKAVDVSMKLYSVDDTSIDSSIVNGISKDSVLLEFPSNGNLPGKTLIRIKDDQLSDYIKGNKYYVYYLDENNNKLEKVALEIQKSDDGYLEFYINHNSKYVISSTKASSSVTSTNEELLDLNTVTVTNKATNTNTNSDAPAPTNNNNNNSNSIDSNMLVYFCLGFSLFIIIIMFIVILRLTKTSKIK